MLKALKCFFAGHDWEQGTVREMFYGFVTGPVVTNEWNVLKCKRCGCIVKDKDE